MVAELWRRAEEAGVQSLALVTHAQQTPLVSRAIRALGRTMPQANRLTLTLTYARLPPRGLAPEDEPMITRPCPHCGERIIYLDVLGSGGKRLAVDARTVQDLHGVFRPQVGQVAHWTRCPAGRYQQAKREAGGRDG